jgi:hypothetical protein
MFGLALPAAAIAAPARLTDSQMDVVTAGLKVETNATGTASGNDAKVKARSVNRVVGKGPVSIGIGKARAKASACCGDEADVATAATATGEGDQVHQISHSFEYEKPNGKKVSKSFAIVVVIDFNRPSK